MQRHGVNPKFSSSSRSRSLACILGDTNRLSNFMILAFIFLGRPWLSPLGIYGRSFIWRLINRSDAIVGPSEGLGLSNEVLPYMT
jgi:hypothetical protein